MVIIAPDVNVIKCFEDNAEYLNELIAAIKKGAVVPFVGAGMSVPLGMKSWSSFLTDLGIKARVGAQIKKMIATGSFEEAAEKVSQTLGKRSFLDELDKEFGMQKLNGKNIGGALALLPKLFNGPVITTNFDHALEAIYQREGHPFDPIVWGSKIGVSIKSFQDNIHILLKMHGDVLDGTDRVLTLGEYIKHYGSADPADFDRDKPLPQVLNHTFQRVFLLFLGTSLSKDRTMRVLKHAVDTYEQLVHYAIVPRPESKNKFLERRRELSNHGIRPIWYPEGQHAWVESILQYLIAQAGSIIKTVPADISIRIESNKESNQLKALMNFLVNSGIPTNNLDSALQAFFSDVRSAVAAALKIRDEILWYDWNAFGCDMPPFVRVIISTNAESTRGTTFINGAYECIRKQPVCIVVSPSIASVITDMPDLAEKMVNR